MLTGRLSPNARGSLYMIIGSLGYVSNDALVRAATEEGLDVYQALFLRGIAMSALFVSAVRVRGEHLGPSAIRGPLGVRVAAELAATALFFAALVRLEFANAQTILLLVPFAVTLVAANLGEPVTRRQYATVLVGFAGVVAVVRPATSAFSLWSIAVVASAGFLVVREFATQRVDKRTPALAIAMLTSVAVSTLTGMISIFTGWGDVTMKAILHIALACLCLIVGYIFTIQTVRVGDLSVSAPFRYTTLVGAVLIGMVLFDEFPDTLTIAGCVTIIVAGLYSIRLERRRQATDDRPDGRRIPAS